jgi:hypothetical protein
MLVEMVAMERPVQKEMASAIVRIKMVLKLK